MRQIVKLKEVKLFLFSMFILSATSCQTLASRKYEEKWNKLFSGVELLNEYATSNDGQIRIKNNRLEQYKLNNIKAKILSINNSYFSKIELKHMKIGILSIQNSDFENVDFSDSSIDELVVRKSDFFKFSCKRCSIKEIKLIESKLVKNKFKIRKNRRTFVEECYIDDSKFYSSEIKNFEIINTKFSNKGSADRSFFVLKTNSLFIKDSSLNVDFGRSKIKTTVLENVSGNSAWFGPLIGDSFIVKDSDVDSLLLGGTTKLNVFKSQNTSIGGIGFLYANINNIYIKDCFKSMRFSIRKATSQKIQIENCNFNRFMLDNAAIKYMSVYNSDIINVLRLDGQWGNMNISEFILDNVYIDGYFDLKNARVGDTKFTNVRKGKNIDIDYEGANFRL